MADKPKNDGDAEKEGDKKYPYPKAVFFIISTEFCERFSYYGMKTVLSLFLKQILSFDEDSATVLYHAFTALCYFTPILGAILADSFLGKYRTIFYVSILYALGQVILTVGSIGEEAIPGLPAAALSFVGLFLIAVGTGGIKPCVAAFGGEQFKLPEQQQYMQTYFSLFYAAINSGSLISTLLTPILRQEVQCLSNETCYPAAFGVPAALMIVSIMIFVAGYFCNFYKLLMPSENIIVKTTACIWHAFTEWRRRRKTEKKDSMLDYAEKKYGKSFINDVKALKSVTYMFLPFPIFWALFDQQGSRWTFQATRMNGDTFGWQILPDQMQVTNPILILAFIPIFDYGIYPLLTKFNIMTTALQRVVVGGIFASASFFISGGLELVLEKTYPILAPANHMNVTFYSGFPAGCDMSGFKVIKPNGDPLNIEFIDFHMNSALEFLDSNVDYLLQGKTVSCGANGSFVVPDLNFRGQLESAVEDDPGDDAIAIFISQNLDVPNEGLASVSEHRERISKSDTGYPFVKFLWNIKGDESLPREIRITPEGTTDTQKIQIGNETRGDTIAVKVKEIGPSDIFLFINETEAVNIGKVDFKVGANYQFIVQYSETKAVIESSIIHKITPENSLYIMWLLPQFIVMTAAEIMFSITSLQFSFTQAPQSMKAVMMSIRFLTNGFGNIINVVVISLLKGVFSSQSHEFFLFASLMFVDALLMAWMATGYTYVDYTTGKQNNDDDDVTTEEKKEKE